MKTVQMTLDEDLIARVDRAARRLKTTRSGFTRQALREALKHITTLQREAQHRRGYAAHPAGRDEFSGWDKEQAWPE
jgi:Predicted transcriptional regulators containing the CopG/Arc/MetJ DNA-binding domain and a metal-binding domain